MRAVAALCWLVALSSGMACAEGLASRGEWLIYDARYAIDEASPFNPGNRLLRQADEVFSSELRPDFSCSGESVTASLKPRLLFSQAAGERDHQLWLNEGTLRWRVVDKLTLTAGREVLLWGPAQFWNPSNPFYVANGKSNARRELSGKGFVRARWQASEASSITAISQVDNGPFDLGAERVNAVKVDWVGNDASAAALVAALPGASLQWRGWAQWTVDDASLVYGEAAWARRSALAARRAATLTGWQVAGGDASYALDALVGAGYTFLNGWTLNAEYYRHGSGLSPDEMADWNRLVRAAGSALASSALAAGQLAAALDPGSDPLGRRVMGVQLRNGSDQALGWNLRYSRNLDDRSGQAVAQFSVDLADRWQLWANLVIQHGGTSTEYGRWLDGSAMLGVTAFLW